MSALLHESTTTRPLRFITCGSVDDGKSTLIGRLLYDSKAVLADHIAALSRSKASRLGVSAHSDEVDLSLLTDGLEAEREQGITIDVAYRYFATARRKFIIADAPGHEQYTRNMVTGASNSDVAVLLIDVTKLDFTTPTLTLLPQTKRHAALASLLRLKAVVLAVNKMDAVGYSEDVFNKVTQAFSALAEQLGSPLLTHAIAIPVSALRGANVVSPSPELAWFKGPTLIDALEHCDEAAEEALENITSVAVQYVSRVDGQRYLLGRVAGGELRVGDSITLAPSGATARVQALNTPNGAVETAQAGQSVSVVLDEQRDVSRGDTLFVTTSNAAPDLKREFEAQIAWLDNTPLNTSRRYWLRHGTKWTLAKVSAVSDKLDLASLAHIPATEVQPNDIATVKLMTQEALPVAAFAKSREQGAFVLVDSGTLRTAAAGMVTLAA
jgi:sulfate adenylyltransferase subunit 1